jgi:BirA family biotin operon repressor/biotin-[acetyl-CoA-carboxylase] ligase
MQGRSDSFDSAEGTPAAADSPPAGEVWPDWIRGRIVFDELPSTQDEARRLVAEGCGELPFFVQALRQTAGRGRGENRWSAGEGALAFTLVFDPATLGLGPERVATLSIATALALCESLQRFSPAEPLAIKWPNDVYAAGRKLCGILIETVQGPAGGSTVALVGIGVNVNNAVPTAEVEGRAPAINLAELAGEKLPAEDAFREVLAPLLARLEREYRALAAHDAGQVERWKSRNLLHGRRCRIDVQRDAPPLAGIVEAIDADGALLLNAESGLATVRSGSIVAWE